MLIGDMLIDKCVCVYEVDVVIPVLQMRRPRLENIANSNHRTSCSITMV